MIGFFHCYVCAFIDCRAQKFDGRSAMKMLYPSFFEDSRNNYWIVADVLIRNELIKTEVFFSIL